MPTESHNSLPIYHGHPWSPYIVFLRRTDLNDVDVLRRLGKQDFVRLPKLDERRQYVAIGRDPSWTHIADNYGYSNWHSKQFREYVQGLASESDLFSFSIGDTDMSFDFELYQDGELVRRLVWEDPKYDGGFLSDQVGSPLEGEDLISMGNDPVAGLWKLAAIQGIETDYSRVNPKLYAAPE